MYVAVACLAGLCLELSGIFVRPELQTINRRFESRPWLKWTPESLKRLNLVTLWNYHEAHEIPRRWWAWNYTLSWLIENNHPEVKHKFIIFNHLLEDEPPAEAVQDHPWMKPLMQWPPSRRSMADVIEFLARSGARLIILDNDFPQYSGDDAILAHSIMASTSGSFGHKVPVVMARTINKRSSGNIIGVEIPSTPSGVLSELQKEEGESVTDKYTGITGVFMDEDQVVRRLAARIKGSGDKIHESIVLRALKAIGEKLPVSVPNELNIDFVGPPNSELYPVRPFPYLLDPELRSRLTNPLPDSGDVTLKNAIVILGDGVQDVFSTPTTNMGINSMSGSEVLINSIDTISRKSWSHRVTGLLALLYIALVSTVGGLILVGWKHFYEPKTFTERGRNYRLFSDSLCLFVTVLGAYF